MTLPFHVPSEGVDDSPSVVCRINKQWVSFMLGLLSPLELESYWTGDEATQYQGSQQGIKLLDILAKGNYSMIGDIVPTATSFVASDRLPCDGSLYNRVDYPELYAVIDPAFIVNADQFRTPDLRGRVPVGAGDFSEPGQTIAFNIGVKDGTRLHTLTVAEMPVHTHVQNSHNHLQDSHNHTQNSHNHTQTNHGHAINLSSAAGTSPAAVRGGGTVEILQVSTNAANLQSATATNQPTTATNQPATAVNQNSGGGAAHFNMQPYQVIRYCIIAR